MLQKSPEFYRGYRGAGIRLSEDLLDELEFHRTESFRETIAAIHAFDKAHVVMLTEEGLIPRGDGRRILGEIRRMESRSVQDARLHAQGGEHSGEQHLIQVLGEEVGGRINLARSSGDLGEVGRRGTVRVKVVETCELLNDFRSTMIRLADRHAEVVMPGQTFLQHAQPTSLGHWFAMWAEVTSRNVARLGGLYERVNRSPAGAGILTGSDFPINRDRVSELLGFDAPLGNTFDAVMSHDVGLEALSAVAILWCDLARMADDVELWLSSEFAYVDVPDRFCDTSSIMPQKRNPGLPQQIKAKAAKAIGAVTTGFVAERGASGQTMLERYEADRLLWELFTDMRPLVGDLTLMLDALEPDADRLRNAAGDGWATASDLAGLIVRCCGLSWRTAHQITGIVVRLALERGVGSDAATPELVDEAAELYFGRRLALDPAEIAEALHPVAAVHRRTLYGGPAPTALEVALGELRADLANDVATVSARRSGLEEAGLLLESAIDRVLSNPA